jgi:hypothetical protein
MRRTWREQFGGHPERPGRPETEDHHGERQDQVKALYAQWAKTGECVFFTDDEELSIGDSMICSDRHGLLPKPGALLSASGFDVDDENAMYISKRRSRKGAGPSTTTAALPVRTCGSPIPAGQGSASWIQPM